MSHIPPISDLDDRVNCEGSLQASEEVVPSDWGLETRRRTSVRQHSDVLYDIGISFVTRDDLCHCGGWAGPRPLYRMCLVEEAVSSVASPAMSMSPHINSGLIIRALDGDMTSYDTTYCHIVSASLALSILILLCRDVNAYRLNHAVLAILADEEPHTGILESSSTRFTCKGPFY